VDVGWLGFGEVSSSGWHGVEVLGAIALVDIEARRLALGDDVCSQ